MGVSEANVKMEGGNGATSGSGITQFAEGEPKRWKRATSNDAAKNAPWMVPVSGANLTVCRQGKAEASKNLENAEASPPRWFAGVFARQRNPTKTIDERFASWSAAA